jgi:hypothetical protein
MKIPHGFQREQSVDELLREMRDEVRSGKHDDFILENSDDFKLTLLKHKYKQPNQEESEQEDKPFDPLSINP